MQKNLWFFKEKSLVGLTPVYPQKFPIWFQTIFFFLFLPLSLSHTLSLSFSLSPSLSLTPSPSLSFLLPSFFLPKSFRHLYCRINKIKAFFLWAKNNFQYFQNTLSTSFRGLKWVWADQKPLLICRPFESYYTRSF